LQNQIQNKLMDVMRRYQRPSTVQDQTQSHPKVAQTEPYLSPVSQVSEPSGLLSPAQIVAHTELGKRGITPESIMKYVPMLNMIVPNAARGIEGMVAVMQNPELLNQALHETVEKLTEVLKHDDEFLRSQRDQPGETEESGRVGISTTGVRSWDEGHREVDFAGDSDVRIPTELLGTEKSGEDVDNRHQAEIPVDKGIEWDTY